MIPTYAKKNQAGFSLIEAIIGTTIFALIFLSIPSALVKVRQLNFETDSVIRTNQLISAELENLKTQEFATLQAKVDTPETTSLTSLGTTYTLTIQVSTGSSELNNMLDVVVNISWTENGRTQIAAGRAFFSENGLSDKTFSNGNS